VANTQSKEVNLTKRVQTSKGLRYCPVALSPNGRVKPDCASKPTSPSNTFLISQARACTIGGRLVSGCKH